MEKLMCVLIIIATCIFCGCSKDNTMNVAAAERNKSMRNSTSVAQEKIKSADCDASSIYTKGNYSYIVVDMKEIDLLSPSSHGKVAPCVVNLLDAFEGAHPELEIIEWKVDKESGNGEMMFYGIWITHRKKK